MDQALVDFFLNENININTQNFVQNIIVALILSLIVKYVYVKFSTTLSNKNEFSKNFVILGLTTCIVITIVKSSLALSLGLVGALSIVRFRAAIKEPEELVFLFLIIAIGLGTGAGQTYIVTIGVGISLILIIIFYYFQTNKKSKDNSFLNLSISMNTSLKKREVDELIKTIEKQVQFLEISSLNQSKNDFNLNIFFQLDNKVTISLFNDKILKKFPNSNIIISKDHNISL
tara:strand:+ start:611 stop:1303 length:693 start_codon:yes stop_codon:yes gene_type:complete